MTKIPVGSTIASAFGFAFGGFPTLMRLMWLPQMITLGASYLMMPIMIRAIQGTPGHPLAGLSATPIFPVYYTISLTLMFMQVAGIAQLALGLETGSRWFYFSLAAPVWRLAGAFILAMLIIIASYVALIVAGIVIGVVARSLGAR